MTEVEARLAESHAHTTDWKQWGPYLAERAWGTVREDYSADGSAWDYFPHDHARMLAYRWNEDGLLGICDRRQYLCFALALWNHADPILKERCFGLTGPQGKHGEDVKEYYYYLDSTPTHCYMRALYKYPQAQFPYEQLLAGNNARTKADPEYELSDTGVFNENRYFDVFIEYAKAGREDILITIEAFNRGPETAPLDLVPTLWFRNTWDWGEDTKRPTMFRATPSPPDAEEQGETGEAGAGWVGVQTQHPVLGAYQLLCEAGEAPPELLFTENESNLIRAYGPQCRNQALYVKDAFHDYIVQQDRQSVNPDGVGTKAAARYTFSIPPGESRTVRLRLTNGDNLHDPFGPDFAAIRAARLREADAFYAPLAPDDVSHDARNVQRQAFAGMLWSKQFYHYGVQTWLDGDPGFPTPPPQRQHGRNSDWRHLYNAEVLSMPDTWEYPWYAAWDLAFHTIPLALIDPDFAKRQLLILCRDWFLHPNGQLPAYEWAFGDVNPPVHAWAAMRVYRIERRLKGQGDRAFLERVFHKLMLNFTWWVNRKDPEGRNVFQGGFLGLDNIGIFDRSAMLPNGEQLEQSDGTAWMGFFCLSMLTIAIELARDNPVYEDMATKFFEHFLYIAAALNNIGGADVSLWNDEDQFFYDVLRLPDHSAIPLKVRSLVGLIPLLAVTTIEQADLDRMPAFTDRMNWFLTNRPDLSGLISRMHDTGQSDRRLLALVRSQRMRALLHRMLDPAEFLSEHGIRSVSKFHQDHPYTLMIDDHAYRVDYEPAESTSELFGGNSNWRGPVWFPLNYLIIEALQRFDYYYGRDTKVEFPTGSGQSLTLWEISQELSRRLARLFLKDDHERRPYNGDNTLFQTDPHWRDLILFHEYFHGDTGRGLGASHQTGWTGLVAKLIQQSGE